MVDPVSVAAIVVSAITAISAAAAALHIRKMKSGCLDCDCTPQTPLARSPTSVKPPVIIMQPNTIGNGKTVETSTTSSEV